MVESKRGGDLVCGLLDVEDGLLREQVGVEEQNDQLQQGRFHALEKLVLPLLLDELLLLQPDNLKVLDEDKSKKQKGDGAVHDEYEAGVLGPEGGHRSEKGQEY